MEFTGLHQKTTPISIGLISDCGKSFYAEFTDYDKKQVDDWLKVNVIDKLLLKDKTLLGLESSFYWTMDEELKYVECTGKKESIKDALTHWLESFEKIEMWGDCLAYDWVLFCEIFGGAFCIPINVDYIAYDICTVFKNKGIDPDCSREIFSDSEILAIKHNALADAKLIKKCYDKLMSV